MNNLLSRFGLLRLLLALSTLVLAAASLWLTHAASIAESGLFLAAIAPSLVAIIVFVIPLDMAMTRIFMSDAQPTEYARLAWVFKAEAVLLLLLVVAWTPFFSSLLIAEP